MASLRSHSFYHLRWFFVPFVVQSNRIKGIFLQLVIVVHGSLVPKDLEGTTQWGSFSRGSKSTPSFLVEHPEEELLIAPEKSSLIAESFTIREHLGVTDKKTTDLNANTQTGIKKNCRLKKSADRPPQKCGLCDSGYTIYDRQVRPINCKHYFHEKCIMHYISNGYPVIGKKKTLPYV